MGPARPPHPTPPTLPVPQAPDTTSTVVQRGVGATLGNEGAGAEFMVIQFIFTSTLRIVPSKRNGRRSK